MSKELIKILETLAEPASHFGMDEGELASFVVVAKFNTELSNDTLANTMRSLLVRMQDDSILDVFEKAGIKTNGKDLYEVLDCVVDSYPTLAEADKAKIIEAFGGVLVTNLVLQVFGKINNK